MVDGNDRGACESAALRILQGASQSKAGLVRRLERHGYSGDVADDVVEQLAGAGWVDDSQLASAIAAKRSRTGYGRRRIANDLMSRRVSESSIGEALASVSAESELASATSAAEKLRRRYPEGKLQQAALSKLAAALQRRGFAFDVIRNVLRNLDT